MRYTVEEAAQLTKFLREGDTSAVFALYQKRYPPRNLRSFPDMQESAITSMLTVRPPTLSFLPEEDLRELQVAAAHVICGGNRRRPQDFFSQGFVWRHAMLPRAALSHIFSHQNWIEVRESWKQLPFLVVIRVSHSCDPGICEACSEAGKYLYTKETVPDFPIAGCTNLKEGCRCAWVVYPVHRVDPVDDLIKKHGLIPKWSERPKLSDAVTTRRP